MSRRATRKTAVWTLDTDAKGAPFWRGGWEGDPAEIALVPGELLILNPTHFPRGIKVIVREPFARRVLRWLVG